MKTGSSSFDGNDEVTSPSVAWRFGRESSPSDGRLREGLAERVLNLMTRDGKQTDGTGGAVFRALAGELRHYTLLRKLFVVNVCDDQYCGRIPFEHRSY